jgi:hypothetical protein
MKQEFIKAARIQLQVTDQQTSEAWDKAMCQLVVTCPCFDGLISQTISFVSYPQHYSSISTRAGANYAWKRCLLEREISCRKQTPPANSVSR